MNLQPVEQNQNYPIAHLKSERWEMGIYPVMFGFRVRAGLIDAAGCEVDYCAGGDINALVQIYSYVFFLLSSLEETTAGHELSAMLPTYACKPIQDDPQCWEKLSALVDNPPKEHQVAFLEKAIPHWIKTATNWAATSGDFKGMWIFEHFLHAAKALNAYANKN